MRPWGDPVQAVEDLAQRVLARKRLEGAPSQDPANAAGPSAVLRLVERANATAMASATPGETAPPQLPRWADSVRGVPNAFLRSALFGVMRRGPRKHVEHVAIASVQGVEMLYSGAQLDQGDLDVWEMLVHRLREQALGSATRLSAYQMLQWLGKQDTGGKGGNRDTLDARLSRLNATSLNVRVGQYQYEGSLIDQVERDNLSRQYVIRLNPTLQALFAKDQYTELDATIRRALAGQPLSQWLHGFYSSHAAPLPVCVRTIYQLCGSSAKRLDHFRQDLRQALINVTNQCQANGQAFSAEIVGDLVHVKRTPSRSQRKHLAKRLSATQGPRNSIPP